MQQSKRRVIPEGKTQINVNIPVSVYEKMKAIAALHGHTHSEVYNLAFAKFIELYEKKNGPVKPSAKKKSINL
jgi:hypothetical protein